MFVVIIIAGVKRYFAGEDLFYYLNKIVSGIIKPSLPNGGWSITAEFHFYLILPALLFFSSKWQYSLIFVLLAAVVIRVLLHQDIGEIQTLSYWTIIGRIDQFLLGILVYQFRHKIAGKHLLIFSCLGLFLVFYHYFDSLGGFYMYPSYPSPSLLWAYLPAIEGLAYAMLIAWYDNSFKHSTGKVSLFVAKIGTYSYSIYLLHFFVVFSMANVISLNIIDLSNIYYALLFSALCFLMMVPAGYMSYRFIEKPFLRFRTSYIVKDEHTLPIAEGLESKSIQ